MGCLVPMRVWGKGKAIIENWWKIKINRFNDIKAIFNNDFLMLFNYFMPIEKRVWMRISTFKTNDSKGSLL